MPNYITTGASSDSDIVWHEWADSTGTATTSNGSGNVWSCWTSADATSGPVIYSGVESYRETDEQRQARSEREEQRREELETARRQKEAAQYKADELLRESLDKEQLEQFNQSTWFFVIGQSGKRYRIRHDWIGNIEELNAENQVVAEYCIHPSVRVPVEDSMLVQKLMLEADEPRFMQIANRTDLLAPRPMAV